MRTPGLQILPRISVSFWPEAALEIVREDAKLREVMAICILWIAARARGGGRWLGFDPRARGGYARTQGSRIVRAHRLSLRRLFAE
jgi:hypothetical protein